MNLRLWLFPGAFFCACSLCFASPTPGAKIVLSPDMVVGEAMQGNAEAMVDEQALAGDPAAGQSGTPKTAWFPDWPIWHYPSQAYLDLGRRYRLTGIYLYNDSDPGHVTVSAGRPFRWTPLWNVKLSHAGAWIGQATDTPTRYVQISLDDAPTRIPEIVLYGVPLEAAPKPPVPVVSPRPTMDQLIGINAFIDDPLDKMAVAGFVREYHSWSWDDGDQAVSPAWPAAQNKWNPSYAAGGGWDFDSYYAGLKAQNITVCPCVQSSVLWLTGGDSGKLNNKAVLSGADPTDPRSYIAHADHLFQYAARYGGIKVADSLLKLAPDQPRRAGLNLLHYYENWNEQDRWWADRASYYSPYEFAAMCSADYDGDRGLLGKTVGVKNADSQARLVMGGTAGLRLGYIKAMKAWADEYRGGIFPADVINVHHYSSNGGEQSMGTTGISPEADNLSQKLQAFADYRDRYLPGKQFWITEFGYDTNPRSPQRAPAIGGNSAEEVQGEWLVRSYLACAAAGVDRAAMYMLRDINPADPTQFSTSGLVTEKGKWVPKPSWYYVYTLKNRLAGMHFLGDVPSEHAKVSIYAFGKTVKRADAYAVWCLTSDASTVSGYVLHLPKHTASATLVTLTAGQTSGTATPLTLTDGSVTLDVSERPVLVLVGDVR